MIPFNKPHLFGKELDYIREAVNSGKISGDGAFSKRCQLFFEQRFHFPKTLLTSSCTDAMEMIALLCDIQHGDEIIAPSYTFVSTVNPFVLRGAHILFCDVKKSHPCIDEDGIEALITPRTRAIVLTHYAGIACNMDSVMQLAEKHDLYVVEDAAHAINGFYRDKPLGSIGDFGAMSFHETKNVMAGEGGLLMLNDQQFVARAEILREKGTNRSRFFRGETDKYQWMDVGSSYLPSEITAAFLYAQLENIDAVQEKRNHLWLRYYKGLHALAEKGCIQLPSVPDYAKHNSHLFYIITGGNEERTQLISFLERKGIMAIFHYLPLHSSPFWKDRYCGPPLVHTEYFADTLLRLPLFYDLTAAQADMIVESVNEFYVGK
jgi:dTDP-4-amino-4,6-dideoxygalactose transaminase